jgi:GT2 family glycosyltransferase
MNNQTVTVVIVNWNSGVLLAECLEHLAMQSRAPNRILVMDNGSADGSADCARRFPSVTLRLLGVNLGFSAAMNRALAEVDTEYVALLNPDANAESGWLEGLLAAAAANPDVVAFSSRQMSPGAGGIIDGLGDIYHISGLAWRRGFGRPLHASDLIAIDVFAACGAAALYRHDALVRAGGFDEDYFCYCEDVDLGFRLRLAGQRCRLVPEAVVHHRGCATTGGHGSDFSVYHGHRNIVWMFIKDMPGAMFWLLLPVHLLQNLAIIVCFVLRGQGGVICRAKWDALMGVPRAWRKRQRVQAQRVASLAQIWHAMDRRIIPSSRRRAQTALTFSS